jgi:hypothetical protein
MVEPRCFWVDDGIPGDLEVFQYGHYTIKDEGRAADPTFYYRIRGKGPEFRFSMKSIPEDRREWLAQVIRRQLYEAYMYGREEKTDEVEACAEKMMAVLGLERR